MARRRQVSIATRLSRRHGGLVVVASSAAAAAGISATRLIRHRAAERERRRFQIDPGRPAGPELRRVAAGQLDIALQELSGSPDGEAIHETRKALKRSRAVLRIGRHLLGPDAYRQENRRLRDAGRALSDSRDADVLRETVAGLGRLPEGSVERLRDAVAAEPRADPQLVQEKARSGISQARARVAGWPLPGEAEPAPLGPGIKRIYRQGRRALAEARRSPDDERWHELRKRSKDLWYAAQLLEPSQPERMRTLVRRARRLSKLLGEDHDLAVLEQRLQLRAHQLDAGEVKLIRRLIGRRRRKLQSRAQGIARRLYRRKPGKFVSRLGLG